MERQPEENLSVEIQSAETQAEKYQAEEVRPVENADSPFSRMEALLGTGAVERLRRARVAVFGVGGVGGYVV